MALVTYNVYICISVAAGAAVGYAIFGGPAAAGRLLVMMCK